VIVVHHLNLSRSQRVLWLLEELGLPYEVKPYERDAKTLLAPPELRTVHALGKSPVITEGDLVLAESGAILEYLAERAGSALAPPPGSPDRARYLYWLHYAEGSLMPPLFLKLLFDRIEKARVPFFLKPVTRRIGTQGRDTYVLPQLKRHLDFIEGELAQRPWFAGETFSAADIQMSYPVEAAERRVGLQGRPHLQDYQRRIRERPAYQRAQQRGGPFGIPAFRV
jgi:glutathione S-transferase